jgi:[ribosomal protein S5]-alanine N-acetyltransferase
MEIPPLPPVLETERLRLRPFTSGDLEGLWALDSDPEVMRYGSHVPWTAREQAEAKLARILDPKNPDQACVWVIADRSSDVMRGDVVLYDIELTHARCELGYSLLPSAQGKGFARESLSAALRWGFEVLGLMRIEADVDPRNLRSVRLLEKLGFQKEGFLRQRWRVGGEVQDASFYGLLRSEFIP